MSHGNGYIVLCAYSGVLLLVSAALIAAQSDQPTTISLAEKILLKIGNNGKPNSNLWWMLCYQIICSSYKWSQLIIFSIWSEEKRRQSWWVLLRAKQQWILYQKYFHLLKRLSVDFRRMCVLSTNKLFAKNDFRPLRRDLRGASHTRAAEKCHHSAGGHCQVL